MKGPWAQPFLSTGSQLQKALLNQCFLQCIYQVRSVARSDSKVDLVASKTFEKGLNTFWLTQQKCQSKHLPATFTGAAACYFKSFVS